MSHTTLSEINATTEVEFDKAVAGSTGPVLVVFTAPTWCQPCKRFEPHWDKAQEQDALSHFTFVKVDMGESPEDTGQHWASARYGIQGVPQVKVFREGEPVDVKARAVIPLVRELTG